MHGINIFSQSFLNSRLTRWPALPHRVSLGPALPRSARGSSGCAGREPGRRFWPMAAMGKGRGCLPW